MNLREEFDMKRTMITVVAASAAAMTLLAGCGGSGSTATGSDGSLETVKYALQQDPGVLNPLTNATGDGVQLATFAYESLLSSPAGKASTGNIAKEWKATTTEATFTLKDDVLCSDGTKLTPSDVKATFDYVVNKAPDSQYNGVYVPDGVQVTADDKANTVSFKVDQPSSFLAEAVGSLPIVCPAGLKNPKDMDTKTFGTGPYQLKEMKAGQSYTYERNDKYESGLPDGTKITDLPKTIEASVVTDQSTEANMLGSGDLNLVKLTGSSQDRVDTSTYKAVKGGAMPMTAFFNQNSSRATGDRKVREAIATALDRTKLAAAITGGKGEVMKTILPGGSSICSSMDSSSAIPKFSEKKAKAMLDEDGWKEGSDGVRAKDGKKLTVKVLYNSTAGAEVAAGVELMQKELKSIGVDAQLTPSDSYTDVIFSGGDWDITVAGISASDPAQWYGILSGPEVPDGGNWTYNEDQDYFTLADAAGEKVGEDSCPAWQKAEDQLMKNVTLLPIGQSYDMYYANGFTIKTDATGNILPTTFKKA